MSDKVPPGKPPSRFVLFAPFVAIVLGMVVLSLIWAVVRTRALTEIEARAGTLRAQGYQVSWTKLEPSGFPFRLRLRFEGVKVVSPAGFSLSSDRIEALTLAYAPDHWVISTDAPLRLGRPQGGEVVVKADRALASLSDCDKPVWRMALDLENPVFTPVAGAAPFSLDRAGRLTIETRQSPANADDAEALVRWENARVSRTGSLALLGPDHLYSGGLALRLTSFIEFQGTGWSSAGRRWVREGGEFEVDPVDPPASEIGLGTPGSTFLFDKSGYGTGELSLDLRAKGEKVFHTLVVKLDKDGAFFGGKKLGPSPRFF